MTRSGVICARDVEVCEGGEGLFFLFKFILLTGFTG